MPFIKYREWAQWGKMNTRILKEMYKAKLKRNAPGGFIKRASISIPGTMVINEEDPRLPPKRLKVYSAQEMLDELDGKSNLEELPRFVHPSNLVPKYEDHPLYKPTPAYVYDATVPLSDGLDQVCNIFGAAPPQPIPQFVYDYVETVGKLKDVKTFSQIKPPFNMNTLEGQVADLIMHAERYDSTFEKLERRHDSILFWVNHRRVWGIPHQRKNNVLLDNLYRKITQLAIEQSELGLSRVKNIYSGFSKVLDHKVVRDAPFSSFVNHGRFQSSQQHTPLVIRNDNAHLTIQSSNPNALWADEKSINETIKQKIPNIYPLSPYIDFKKDQIYNDAPIISLLEINKNLHLNALLWSLPLRQKYPWTTEQNISNAVMYAFGAAIAQLDRRNMNSLPSDKLTVPILMKCVQIFNGRIDLAAVQLNTLNFTEDLHNENTIKNIVFCDRNLQLYKPKPYWENMDYVEDLNMNTFKKLTAFLLY